jgi:hypothetical protein
LTSTNKEKNMIEGAKLTENELMQAASLGLITREEWRAMHADSVRLLDDPPKSDVKDA